jgi:hypothetical protein
LVRSDRGLFIYTSLNSEGVVTDDALKRLAEASAAAVARYKDAETRKKASGKAKTDASARFKEADAARKEAKKAKKPASEIDSLQQEADRLEALKEKLADVHELISAELDQAEVEKKAKDQS